MNYQIQINNKNIEMVKKKPNRNSAVKKYSTAH